MPIFGAYLDVNKIRKLGDQIHEFMLSCFNRALGLSEYGTSLLARGAGLIKYNPFYKHRQRAECNRVRLRNLSEAIKINILPQ